MAVRCAFRKMPARRAASPYVSLPGGATLHCVDKGAGDPLLFVHGWTCDAASTASSIRDQHIRRMLAIDPMVVRETFRHLFACDESVAFREHTQACFARRTCPVLAIYGRNAHERVEWEERHSNHPASQFLHLPLGHWLQQDAPDLVNRLIVDWLSTLHHTQEGEDIRGVISESGSCGK